MRRAALSILPCLLLAGPALAQSTWYVDAAAPGPGTGTLSDPFARLDYAVAQPQVEDGDRLQVEPGIYAEEAIVLAGKQLVVQASGAPGSVVIEGADGGADDEPFLRLDSAGTAGTYSSFRGLHFTSFEETFAGSVSMIEASGSAVRFEECSFSGNLGNGGAAMIQVDGGAVSFDSCTWTQNGFGCDGLVRGVAADLRFLQCTWTSNDNPIVLVGGALRLDQNTFLDNLTSTSCGQGFGGLVRAEQASITVVRTSFTTQPFFTSKPFELFLCTTELDGVEIAGGTTKLGPGGGVGATGGLLVCRNSTFQDLTADRGGALSLRDVNASLADCTFEGNRGDIEDFEGGAIHAEGQGSLLIEDCEFQGNASGLGGALGVNFVPTTVLRSTFEGNRATRGTFFDGILVHGGAIYSRGPVTIEDCTFEANLARSTYPIAAFDRAFGGALALGPNSAVRRSTFTRNFVEAGDISTGGAIWAEFGTVVERCVFQRNHSGDTANAEGGALGGEGLANHCTFLGNTTTGEGSVAAAWAIRNSILAPEGRELILGPFSSVEFSLVEGGWPGPGNVASDPGFWSKRDPHLLPGSQAIDAANPNGAPDLDGSPPDMGALPYDPDYCSPNCTGVVEETYCQALPNSTGLPGRAFALGSTDPQEGVFVLAADRVPPQAPGYFLASTTAGFEPLPGGAGVLCLDAPMLRWVDELGPVNAAGQYGRMIRLDQLPGGQPVLSGETWHFQFWFQDSVAGLPVANASSGIRVTFD